MTELSRRMYLSALGSCLPFFLLVFPSLFATGLQQTVSLSGRLFDRSGSRPFELCFRREGKDTGLFVCLVFAGLGGFLPFTVRTPSVPEALHAIDHAGTLAARHVLPLALGVEWDKEWGLLPPSYGI